MEYIPEHTAMEFAYQLNCTDYYTVTDLLREINIGLDK